MSSAAAEHPWRAQAFGDAVAAQRSALVLASYPVLLLLVILAAFVRYLWVALAMYCALLFALSCAARVRACVPRRLHRHVARLARDVPRVQVPRRAEEGRQRTARGARAAIVHRAAAAAGVAPAGGCLVGLGRAPAAEG